MNPKPAQPLTDEQVWGNPESKVKQDCSLKIDGQCPEGCCECAKFYFELVFGTFGVMD